MPGIGSIGMPELLIVLVIIIIVFGVGKLPEIGGALGKGIKEFRAAQQTPDQGESKQAEAKEEKEVEKES